MDLGRIERALREGPADEPRYIPGTFGRRSLERLPWALAALAAVAATALVAALLIGIGLFLRSPNVGPSPMPGPTGDETPGPSTAAAAWTATGAMMEPRFGHTATLLTDGKVLVAGGSSNSSVLASAELYDPASGTWTTTGNMITPRSGHTATLLPDGKVLVAGGSSDLSSKGSAVASSELYDPTSGTWTTTGSMITPRNGHTATLLTDGRVLVAGGLTSGIGLATSTSAELYDPTSETWTATGNMEEGRVDHTATLLRDGKVLVAGGGCSFGNTCPLVTAVLYDPGTGTWTATGNMIEARIHQTATLLPDGTVLVAGGIGGARALLPSAELYDPTSGTWNATGNMTEGRWFHTATRLSLDGHVLVAGGSSKSSFAASADLYDPGTRTWIATGTMIGASAAQTATLLRDGTVLVAGGRSFGDDVLASAQLYEPGSGT